MVISGIYGDLWYLGDKQLCLIIPDQVSVSVLVLELVSVAKF